MTIEQLGKGINKRIALQIQARKQKNIKLGFENKSCELRLGSNCARAEEIIVEK